LGGYRFARAQEGPCPSAIRMKQPTGHIWARYSRFGGYRLARAGRTTQRRSPRGIGSRAWYMIVLFAWKTERDDAPGERAAELSDGAALFFRTEIGWQAASRSGLNCAVCRGLRNNSLISQPNVHGRTRRSRSWRPSLTVEACHLRLLAFISVLQKGPTADACGSSHLARRSSTS
jgi:hypothetical protein